MSNAASVPNVIPLGLIRKKSALPFVRIKPLISETVVPVTRLKIFSIVAGLLKKASASTEKVSNYGKGYCPVLYPL